MKLLGLFLMITQVLSIPLIHTNRPYPLVGSANDEKGCCISCGYTYCDTLLECIRVWETDCPEFINPFLPIDK